MNKTILLGSIALIILSSFVFANPMEGIIRVWQFNESSGTNAEDIIQGDDVTVNTAVAWVDGVNANAGNITYTQNTIPTSTPITDMDEGSSIYTIAGWYNGDPSVWNGLPIFTTRTDAGVKGFTVYTKPNGSISWQFGNGGWTSGYCGSDAKSLEWQYFTMTKNGTTYTFYLDGVKQCDPITMTPAVGNYFYFMDAWNGGTWNTFDEWYMWNRTLDNDEVAELYNGGSGLFYPFSDTTPPTILNLNCTSCVEDPTANQPPYETEDTTPTFKFNTSKAASCVIGRNDQNYTTMNATMSGTCTYDGTEEHTCILPAANRFTSPGQHTDLYISCIDESGNENTTSTSGSLVMEIKGASETYGDSAIDIGITTSEILATVTIYSDQQVSARDLSNEQFSGVFDRVAVSGNQRWAFNYVSSGESEISGLFNLTPVLYVLQLQNQTNETIIDQVGKLINSTYS